MKKYLLVFLMILLAGSGYFLLAAEKVSEDNKNGEEKKFSDNLMRDLYILNEGVRYLHDYYWEEIPSEKMVHEMLKNYMEKLDPYTTFMEKQASREMKMQLQGKYGGVGIVIGLRDNNLVVVSPFEDTPADRAGLKPGDRILKVDEQETKGIDLDIIAEKIRGPIGTVVRLVMLREGEKESFTVELTREEIKLKTVKSTMIENVAYLRISSFNGDTANEVLHEIKILNKNNPAALIIDLRNNPGGLLSEAVKISDYFLDKGKLIVYTKGRTENVNEKYYAESDSEIDKIPLIVLINQGAASGSEILAGALRDNNRAVLIGMKSYGKGCVQNIFNLSDGSSMKVTISRYFTPSGTCIEGTGITPDIEVPLKAPEDLMEKFKNEGLSTEVEVSPVQETEEVTAESEKQIIDLKRDYQLKKALEFLKVYKILNQN